jgi:UPF0755 protein
MKLRSCVAVLYAVGANKVKLTLEDIKFDSLYNAYKYLGLQPGCPCMYSPGIELIKAILCPADYEEFVFLFRTGQR